MRFPENFFDIGNWEFEQVWAQRPEFCKFALGWPSCSGLFKEFQTFCKDKMKTDGRHVCVVLPSDEEVQPISKYSKPFVNSK
jgi:hypothetical protein